MPLLHEPSYRFHDGGLSSLLYQGQFTSCLEIASFYYIPTSISFFQRGTWLARIGFQFKFPIVPEACFSHITSSAPVATRQTSNTDLSAVKVKYSRIWGSFPAWIQSWYSHLTHVFLPFFFFLMIRTHLGFERWKSRRSPLLYLRLCWHTGQICGLQLKRDSTRLQGTVLIVTYLCVKGTMVAYSIFCESQS